MVIQEQITLQTNGHGHMTDLSGEVARVVEASGVTRGTVNVEVVGATVQLRGRIRPDALLFGESTGRVIATTSDADALLELARECGVTAERVGETGGKRLWVGPARGESWLDVPIDSLRERWSRAIPRRMEVS